jgi:hypothetical protein
VSKLRSNIAVKAAPSDRWALPDRAPRPLPTTLASNEFVRLLTSSEVAYLRYSAEQYVRIKNNYLAGSVVHRGG